MSGSNRPRSRSSLKQFHVEMRERAHEDIAAIGIFIAQSHPFNAQQYVDRI